ncbi:MAG: fumarylacetoacetate hydrolase family protein [Giesbergeria sp.]
MKLATLKDGSRDGQLVVVSRDLASAHYATGIANRLQQALDDWGFFAPQLQDLSDALNAGRARHAFPFDPQQCMAPLPRAFQCLQGAALPLAGEASAASPVLQQLAGDALLGPREPLSPGDGHWELDFGAGLAVVTGDLAAASTPGQALDGVRLLMLANTVTLRVPERAEREAGAGPLHSRPATAFSPVAVTLDELGSDWQNGRVPFTLQVHCNGRKLGLLDTAAGMAWGFGELIAQAAGTRALRAGSIVCSGPLRARQEPGAQRGTASLLDKRSFELQQGGRSLTHYLQSGDQIRIDMKGPGGHSLCGAIEQAVAGEAPEPGAKG